MCSATTTEYCEQNKRVNVGDVCIASLAFVNDNADLRIKDTFSEKMNHKYSIRTSAESLPILRPRAKFKGLLLRNIVLRLK